MSGKVKKKRTWGLAEPGSVYDRVMKGGTPEEKQRLRAWQAERRKDAAAMERWYFETTYRRA